MLRSRKMILGLLRIFSKKAPKYPTILCLKEEILQKIHQHLPLVDKVCLCLSCKKLFSLLRMILKHKDLQFPRLLRIGNPIRYVNSQGDQRNQLLIRLENCRWAYCAKCLKLHPRKEFTKHSLRQSALERSCTYYAGIADLCACISLTIRGRDQLVNFLKSPRSPAKPAKAQYSPFEYDFSFDRGGPPGLGHVCHFSTESGYDVQVVMTLFVQGTGQLCVAARHTIRFPSSHAHLTDEATLACPHLGLLSSALMDQAADYSHINQTMLSLKSYQDLLSLVSDKLISRACPWCRTLITKPVLSEDMTHAVSWVVRDLGNCEWPADRHWLDQCRRESAVATLADLTQRVGQLEAVTGLVGDAQTLDPLTPSGSGGARAVQRAG